MIPPSSAWTRELVRRESFPARLDDEFSFLSILRRDPAKRWLKDPRLPRSLEVRITFRRAEPRPSGFFSRQRPTVDFRIEFHGISHAVGLDDKLQLSTTTGVEIFLVASRALLKPNTKLTFAQDRHAAPDPGDLPGVWVIDGGLETLLHDPLKQASNHALMSLSARTDIELLRIA